jgi:RNA polymerase sigma factor (sigma-70 family)
MYEQYSGQLYGFCLNQLGNREEAEDAVQSTFMNAFRGLQRGIVPEAESAWLFKIAHNVCLSRRRAAFRRGRVEFANDLEALQEITPSPHNGRSADDLIRLNDVLATMPENQRKAILLREWQGLSYHEIAAEMELSQSAVETLIFRARRSLAAGLEAAEAPKKSWKRLRTGSNLGSALVALKSLLAGGAAVVAAGSVAAAGPLEHHFSHPAGGAAATSPSRAHARARTGARATNLAVVASAAATDRSDGETPRAATPRPSVAKADGPEATARHARIAAKPVRPAAAVAPQVSAPAPPPAPPASYSEPPRAPQPPAAQAPTAVTPPEPPTRKPAAAPPPAPDPPVGTGKDKDKGKGRDDDDAKAPAPPPPAVTVPTPTPPPASDDGQDDEHGKAKGHDKDQAKKEKEKDPAPPAAAVPPDPPPASPDAGDDEHGKNKDRDDKGKKH